MAASSEYVQSRVIDHIEQTKRGFQRDHLIVAPVNKQCGRRDPSHLILRQAQSVECGLPWLGEHRVERFLNAGADAGLVTQRGEVVAELILVVREKFHDRAHVLHGRLVTPHRIQAARDVESNTDGTHENHPVDPVRVMCG